MGREVKRVPLDFKWPHSKVWFGYKLKVTCQLCDGESDNCALCDGVGAVYPQIDPPKGDGWQMWETTSDGSPISPVFATPNELARWLADTGASAFGRITATYEQWLGMISGYGWAPSAVIADGKMMSGVEAFSDKEQN